MWNKTGLPLVGVWKMCMKGIFSHIWNQNHKSHDANEAKWLRFIKQWYNTHNLYEWQMIMKHFPQFWNNPTPQQQWWLCARSFSLATMLPTNREWHQDLQLKSFLHKQGGALILAHPLIFLNIPKLQIEYIMNGINKHV
jgi:hypothetical protein